MESTAKKRKISVSGTAWVLREDLTSDGKKKYK